MARERSLSGIKPTHLPHWGNYFGMIKPAVELSRTCDTFYFIADYHAMTTPRDADSSRLFSYQTAATLMAAGMSPDSTVLWRQSDVPEVLELSWILSTVTGFGLVERAHSFKDARAKGVDINFGTVSYPVLMAADILLYDADLVPVGKDQTQHLEMTRDMAGHFNQQFLGNTGYDNHGAWTGKGLKKPEAVIRETTGVVPGLDGRKMSKSYDNHIPVFGSPKAIRKRVMSLVTDSKGLEEPKDPTTCNVFSLYKLFGSKEECDSLAARYRAGNFGYGHAKQELYEKSVETFGPMREHYDAFMEDTDALELTLRRGAEKARETARPVLRRVRDLVGLPSTDPYVALSK